jgi:hypothetical protein
MSDYILITLLITGRLEVNGEEVILSSSVLGVNTSHTGELPLGCSASAQVISTYGRDETARGVLFITRSLGENRRRKRLARDVARMGRTANAHTTVAEELK